MSALLRYPVKSMAGEEVAAVEVDGRGLVGDRTWAVRTDDGGVGSGKSTRRFRRVDGLLEWCATLDGGVPVVESPAGERYGVDAAAGRLSDAMGRTLTIEAAEGFPEDGWTGRELALGDDVVLRLGPGMPRCVMVGLPQGDLPKDKEILRTLAQERDLSLGVQASVLRGGVVRVGDPARLR